MTFRDKTVFISGASRGIGLAIACRFARESANIVLAAKTAEAHPKLPGTIYTAAAEVEAAGGKALPLVCDIRDEQQVIAAVTQGVAAFGGIDVCINNASAISLTPTLATDMKRYDLMSQVNSRGTFLSCRTPEIMADAAWAVVSRSARACSGHFFIDEEVLREDGVSDFSRYAPAGGNVPLQADFFIPDVVVARSPTRLKPAY